MTTSSHSSRASARALIVAALVSSGVLAMVLPTFAHAATYAFVNTSNEVSTVVANDWRTAISTAFNIALHSGVLLLTSQNSSIVGTSI